jgi:sugar phosphate isomerase/epimerase
VAGLTELGISHQPSSLSHQAHVHHSFPSHLPRNRRGRARRASPCATADDRGGSGRADAQDRRRKFTLDEALAMARDMNVRYMTFKDVHLPRTDSADALRAARAKIEAAGITIMGGGTITMPNDPAELRKDFEYARACGFPLMFVSPDPASLDVLEALVKEFDIKVAIHNHGPEDKWYPAPADAYEAIAGRDPRMGLCVDIGHTSRTGTDFVTAIVDAKDRLLDLHVKDLSDPMNRDSQVEVGRGVFDFPRLFRALLDIGYSGQVGLEYEIKESNPTPGMIESLAYMHGVLAALTR